MKGQLTTAATGLRFGAPPKPVDSDKSKAKRVAKPKVKIDPRLTCAARELRDRYLEQVNAYASALPAGKYDVSRHSKRRP